MADKKLGLVPNWRNCPKWASMWWSGVGFIASTVDFANNVWTSMDHNIQDRIHYAPMIGMVLFAGTMAGRLLVWVHKEVDHGNDNDQ